MTTVDSTKIGEMMDLNEKLAARRRELAIEADKAKQAERAANEVIAREAAIAKQAEAAVINSEVAKRLAEKGIDVPVFQTVPTSTIDAEVEKALTQAAVKRMTAGENATIGLLVIIGLFGFFLAWWVGVGLIIWAAVYFNKATDRHKAAILAEGETKVPIMAEAKTKMEEGPSILSGNFCKYCGGTDISNKADQKTPHWCFTCQRDL